MQVLGGSGAVHRAGTGGKLPERSGDGTGQPPQQQAANQRQGRRTGDHVQHQMVQRRHRLHQGLLRYHAPAGAGDGGEACEHFHAQAIGQLPGTAVQCRQLVDQRIALHHRPYPLAMGVVQQASVAVDHIQVRTVLVEMLAQQAVEDVAFTQVQAATHIPQVVAVAVENGLR
ncbi:hypothetical protein D9M71_482590 [compost metagenome]